MTDRALASRNENTSPVDTCIGDPFAAPASSSPTSPTVPEPTLPSPSHHSPRHSQRVERHGGTGPRLSRMPQPQEKFGSMSSQSDSVLTPVSSIYLEKAIAKEQAPARNSRDSRQSKRSRAEQDPEKAMSNSQRSSPRRSNNPGIATNIAYEDDEDVDEGRQIQEQHGVKILLFLSGPCVLLSAINTAWACIAIVITLLTQPIRLCSKRPTFGQQLAGLLGPTLNLQLRCIYTPLPPHANEDASYHTFMLLIVHMLSPFLSFVLMFAAWTLAVYWLSSAVVGDPAGQDKRDDGKETVLGLRNWWEGWLLRSVKEE